jgi:hypothetical protein
VPVSVHFSEPKNKIELPFAPGMTASDLVKQVFEPSDIHKFAMSNMVGGKKDYLYQTAVTREDNKNIMGIIVSGFPVYKCQLSTQVIRCE